MKQTFLNLKSRALPDQIPELALRILLAIYPLLLVQVDTGSLKLQTLILFILIMGWLLISFLLIRKNNWQLRRPKYPLDLAVLIAAGYQFLRIIGKLFTPGELGAIHYDAEVMVIILAAIYLLISSKPLFRIEYLDMMLYTGLIVFAALLYRYTVDINFGWPIRFIENDTYAIASYTLLISTVSVLLYCRCRNKLRSVFYMGVAAVGFIILFINHNILSIWMMLTVFIAIPVLFRPTAELVKRDMQLLFAFIFMLANMSLVTNYTGMILTGLKLNLENSVYLDLLLAIGGVCFFQYWERIPEGTDLNKLVLRRMRKGYQFLLKAIGIIFIGIVTGGDRWYQLSDGIGAKAAKALAIPVIEELKEGSGILYLCVEKQGLLAAILLIIFLSLVIARLRKNYYFDKPVTGILIVPASLFLVQLLFWKPSLNTLPVYFILLIFAAFFKEERHKISSLKIKTVEKKEE